MSKHERKNFIEEMRRYAAEERIWLRNALESVGWNVKDLESLATNAVEYDVCPFVSEHRMPASALSDHILACEKKYYCASVPANTDVAATTANNLTETVTTDVVATAAKDSMQIFDDHEKSNVHPQSSSGSIDYVQLLEAERNAKRRRLGHRGKKVRTKKNNYTETLRELIENEMKMFENSYQKETEEVTSNAIPNSVPRCIQKEQFSYLGIGNPRNRGNPFERWRTIEEEEKRTLRSNSVEIDGRSATIANVDRTKSTSNKKICRTHNDCRVRKRKDLNY